jgi:diadenosine tetraphosphate (Ap4A) HIT family hydrolase
MDCPICAWSPNNQAYRFVCETPLWRVVLAPNQSLLGTCIIHLKRHTGELANLTQEELLDWFEIVTDMERALQSAFSASMFNWSCYLNHAYREREPNPHIHWWVVPRYRQDVVIRDWHFEDPHFGNPYDHDRWLEVPKEIHQEIVERIRKAM